MIRALPLGMSVPELSFSKSYLPVCKILLGNTDFMQRVINILQTGVLTANGECETFCATDRGCQCLLPSVPARCALLLKIKSFKM